MSGLVLRLAPHERVLLNGAVIENGDRRSSLSIKTPKANVLRLRDAIHPDEVNTPVKRMCYMAQLVLSGDTEMESARQSLLRGIEQLAQVFLDPEGRTLISQATQATTEGEAYQILKALRGLLPLEARLFAARTQ